VRRRGLSPYALSTPAAAILLVFMLVPLGLILFMSFQQRSVASLWHEVWTLENYARALTDGFYLGIVLDSLRIAFMVTVLCVVIGYPIAWHIARLSGAMRGLCLFLVLCPLLVSTVIRSFGWMVILGDSGVINALFQALGFEKQRLLYSEGAVVVGLVHFLVPFMTLPLVAAIERIPVSLEEAAKSLGSTPFGTFTRVVLPLSVAGLAAGSVLVFTLAVSAVVTPLFLGGRRVQMIGPQIYNNVTVSFNWPFAGALTMLIIVATGAAVLISYLLVSRHAAASGKARTRRSKQGGRDGSQTDRNDAYAA